MGKTLPAVVRPDDRSCLLTVGKQPASPAAEPVPLIFDTDICGDCDDVLALGMIHALESRGACRLLAVTISVDHELAAPFVDAVNTFYGRAGHPDRRRRQRRRGREESLPRLWSTRKTAIATAFPTTCFPVARLPSATAVLRKTLAAQPDRSVVIAQVGFSTNLARLLDSPPDEHSPLTGLRARGEKSEIALADGRGISDHRWQPPLSRIQRRQGCGERRSLAERWPTPMVYSGFEIGIALPYPAVSIERDYGYVPHHPLAEAYIRYIPPPHNRPTWDLTSVLYAVLGDRGYFDLSPSRQGHASRPMDSRGLPRQPQGSHRYLVLKADQKPRVLEALVQLSSQPPQSTESKQQMNEPRPRFACSHRAASHNCLVSP